MMSPNKNKKGAVAIRESSPEAGPSCSKRPRSKMSSDDDEEAAPRKAAPSKHGSNFIRSPGFTAHNKPAELFRKDLISAMKLADSEPLQEGSYFLISDPWRQEWEKGVQVPVNNTQIMQADVKEIREKCKTGDFKMPHKMLHERVDSVYKKGHHELTGMQQLAEQLVRYDLDDLDVCWLEEVNFSRREMGLVQINEWNMERIMEALENQCHEKMTAVMKTEEGMGIEYDEDVVCDVCRSPESEDTNEMVFCDGCDVCIHQACYGIQSIPEGTWLCRTCALGVKPSCMLCPKVGGAMKSTRSGTKWAHVSCALWIPEVSIGVPEKMEPITKISNIPPSRWALICCLCKERVGACIQCSVKTCKTAFHVTCGFSNNLEMKTILDESDEHDGVKLKAYCPKHTKKRERGHSESDTDSPRKESPPTPKKELTQQEKANLRAKKCTARTSQGVPTRDCPSSPLDPTALKSLEEEFYSVVDIAEVCQALQLEEEVVDIVRVYWQLKRKCNWDKPLLTPKTEEADILEKQQEDSLVARMKMFVHLRQDLERVRNLCYMIGKREKMKRQFFRSREYVFTSMVRVLLDKTISLSDADVDDIVHNYHFDSIYDDYGRSVENLPPEPSQDEDEAGEREEKELAKDSREGGESAVEEGREETAAEDVDVEEEEEPDEEPSQPLPPGERWSGEFVRSGFFHRRRHKKWMKSTLVGKARKKKHQATTSSSGTSASAAAVVKQDRADDDSVFFADADESEDEKVKGTSVVKASAEDKVEDGSNERQPPIPKLVVKSQRGFHLHRHRKRHRGRKPWHVKKSHHYDMVPKLDLSTDEDEDMKVSPVVERSKAAVAEEGTASDENVTIDVEGEGCAGEERLLLQQDVKLKSDSLRKSLNSVKTLDHIKIEPGVKTKSNRSKTVHGEMEMKAEIQKPKLPDVETNLDSASVTNDHGDKARLHSSGTKSSKMRTKVDAVVVKSESVLSHDAKQEEEGVGHKHHRPSLPTRTSRRERRRSGQSVSSTEVYDCSGSEPSGKPVDVPGCPEAVGDSKAVVTSRVEAESPALSSPLSSRRRERRGKFKSEKVKAEEAKRAEAGELSSEPPSDDRHRRKGSHRSGEVGERSNIFESLERHCQEGSYEVAEPTKLSEPSDRQWLSSDWHRKLTSLVGDVAEHAKLPESAQSHQPSEQSPSRIPVVGNDHSDQSKASHGCESSGREKKRGHDAGEVGEASDSIESLDRQSRKSRHLVAEAPEPSISVASAEHRGRKRHQVGDLVDRASMLELSQRHQRKSSLADGESATPEHTDGHRRKGSHGVRESTTPEHTDRHQRKSSLVDGESTTAEHPDRHRQKGSLVDGESTTPEHPDRHRRKSSLVDGESTTPEHPDRHRQKGSLVDGESTTPEHPDRQRRKSSLVDVESTTPEHPDRQRRKSSLVDGESTTPEHPDRHRRKGSHGVGESATLKRTERHRRKSSHEARLKLSKVLTAVDGSSDDDFEPSKPMAATFPLRQRHERLSKKCSIKRRTKDVDLSEETSEDEGAEERSEGRGSFRSRHRKRSESHNSLDSSSSRTRTGGLRPELSKLLKPSDLIVEADVIKRVENSFLRRYRHGKRHSLANGVADNKQRKVDSFFLKNSNKRPGSTGDKIRLAEKSPSKNRVLNEITAEKSGNFENHLFGAHCTPRGSLSGYKIPKKNGSQSSTAQTPSSPMHNVPSSGGIFGMGAEFRSFRSEAAAGSPRLRRRGEGGGEERTPRKCVSAAGGGSDLETASVISTEQCEASQFSMDNCRGYRSQSPSSEASTAHARHSDSRESTPRRFTRSQLAEDMAENSPSPHSVAGSNSSGSKMKLREGLLKASHFSC